MKESAVEVGLGYRFALHNDISNHLEQFDFLEVISEQFMHSTDDKLDQLLSLARRLPILPHSVGLSVGTASAIDADYLARLAKLIAAVDAPWYSDHLCLTQVPEADIEQLTPLWRTAEALEIVCRNLSQIQSAIPRPLILENITYYFDLPDADLTDAQFLTQVIHRSGCGLLLDVNNVYTNSINLRFDAEEYLSSIPLDQVVQIHVAGGEWHSGLLVDTHSRPVPERVWELLSFVLQRCRPKAICLEWDADFPEFAVLLHQLDRAREVVANCSVKRPD